MLEQTKKDLLNLKNPERAKILVRFFKTGKDLRYAIERFNENKRRFYLKKY